VEFVAMSSTHYILAKHIPDVFRKEPRNIGVIVWSEHGIAAQFWGVDSQGVLDKRQIPPFVNSPGAYGQWVEFWLREITKPKVEFIGSGEFADISSPKFLQAIQTGNSDNYFLQESGTVFEEVTRQELPGLAKELFETLVTSDSIDEPDTSALVKSECEKIIRSTQLNGNRHFIKGKKVFPTIGTGNEQKTLIVEFSYAFENGSVQWLGQQVALKRYPSQLTKEIRAVCYQFERVLDNGFVNRDRAASFVYPMDDQVSDKTIVEAIELLKIYSTVVNLRDPGSAKREFDKVASIPTSHN
jgi:hypothetical protein